MNELSTLDNLIMVFGVFGSATLVIFILARYNYLIKKAYAEHGIDSPVASRISLRDMACLLLSLGLGLGIASVFTTLSLSEDTIDMLVYATLLICGGSGLFLAHYLRKRFDH